MVRRDARRTQSAVREVVEGREPHPRERLRSCVALRTPPPPRVDEVLAEAHDRVAAVVRSGQERARRIAARGAPNLDRVLERQRQRDEHRRGFDGAAANLILLYGRRPELVAAVKAMATARAALSDFGCDATVSLCLNAVACQEAGLRLTREQVAAIKHLGDLLAAADRRPIAPPPPTDVDADLPVQRLDDALRAVGLPRSPPPNSASRSGSTTSPRKRALGPIGTGPGVVPIRQEAQEKRKVRRLIDAGEVPRIGPQPCPGS